MSRFTLYLYLLVGLIAIVSVAAQGNKGSPVQPNAPSESCLQFVYLGCREIQDKAARQACIVEGIRKICHGN